MADNDDRNIPVLEATEEGVVKSQAINEQVKQIYQTLHYLEGRVGPTVVRDDLGIMGSLSLEERDEVPPLSEEGEAVLYLDADGQVKVSQDGGAFSPLALVSPSSFTTIRSVDGVQEAYDPLSYYDVVDDFGPISTNFAGVTAFIANFAGTGSLTAADYGAGHPGTVELRTGGTINSRAAISHAAAAAGTNMDSSGFRRLQWVVFLTVAALTNCTLSLGLGGDPATTNLGNEAIYFQVVNGGNWQCVTKTGGVATTTDSGVASSNDWFKLEVVRVEAGQIDFYINDVLVASNVTNIPLGQSVAPVASVVNTAAASKIITVDYYRLIGTTIGSRF